MKKLPVARRTQLSKIAFVVALLAMIGLLASAARDAQPMTRLEWAVLAIVMCSAGIFLRAWSVQPDQHLPPTPLAKLLPPSRRNIQERNRLDRNLRG